MHEPGFVTYEEFGRRFFEFAVTEERVAAAFAADIAGDSFEMGPMLPGAGRAGQGQRPGAGPATHRPPDRGVFINLRRADTTGHRIDHHPLAGQAPFRGRR